MTNKTIFDFTLLIPHYNNKEGLTRSLASIQYPFSKFCVLVIDDGSDIPLHTDDFKEFTEAGMKIILKWLDVNSGITTALNTGLDFVLQRDDCLFIARLDCGDECSPDRFYRQVQFLKKNPQIVLLGTWCRFVNRTTGENYIYKAKTTSDGILREMHYKCSFIHPTVMFSINIVKNGYCYPSAFPHAEDYALFFEIARSCKTAILPEVLVTSEQNAAGISVQKRTIQLQSRKKIIKTLGTNWLYKIWGVLYINLLMLIPETVIKKLKHLR